MRRTRDDADVVPDISSIEASGRLVNGHDAGRVVGVLAIGSAAEPASMALAGLLIVHMEGLLAGLLGIKEQVVVHALIPLARRGPAAVAPDHVVEGVVDAEDRVHHDLQVVARGLVAVQVDASRRLQDAMQLDEPHRHHRQIGGHPIATERTHQRFEQDARLRRSRAVAQQLRQCALRVSAPMPGVVEGFELRGRGVAGLVAEEDVVGRVGLERGIEIDQVHRLVGNLLAQNRQVVAVEE